MDITVHRCLTPAVAARRALRRSEFAAHVWFTTGTDFEQLLMADSRLLDQLLASYGQLLLQASRSLLDFSETINAVVDADRRFKGVLPRAWDAAWVWCTLLPAGTRIAIPEKILLALMSIAVE